MWGGNLLFATREEAVDRHLFALAAMSDTSHDYTDAKVLQNWLADPLASLDLAVLDLRPKFDCNAHHHGFSDRASRGITGANPNRARLTIVQNRR
jgi:hypothetical protein